MINNFLKQYFDFLKKPIIRRESLKKTEITLEMPLEEKVKIINENKGKKALIKDNRSQKYVVGIIEPKDNTAFGLKIIKNITEETKNYFYPVFYRNLSELMVTVN